MPTMSVYVSDELYQFLARKTGKDKKPGKAAAELLEERRKQEEGGN